MKATESGRGRMRVRSRSLGAGVPDSTP